MTVCTEDEALATLRAVAAVHGELLFRVALAVGPHRMKVGRIVGYGVTGLDGAWYWIRETGVLSRGTVHVPSSDDPVCFIGPCLNDRE